MSVEHPKPRRYERAFDFYVLTMLVVIFVVILEAMARAEAKDAVLPILGGALSVDLGLIGLAAAHLWNAQKKTDGATTRAADVPPNTQIDQTTTMSTKTPPAQ